MYGTAAPMPGAAITGTDLGLYSITFNNDLDADLASLEAFAEFRAEAAAPGSSYFLEVFNPNIDTGIDAEICRTTSTTTSCAASPASRGRPAAVPEDRLQRPARRWRSWPPTTRA